VFYEPAHPYTKALAAAFPAIGDDRFRMAPSGLPGDPPYPQELPSGCTFHPRCPVVFDACSDTDPHLFEVRERWRAACLLVESAKGSLQGASAKPDLSGADGAAK
jgi:peptide/nickel transport system ATP-binding protein